jgi:hypothetical protein
MKEVVNFYLFRLDFKNRLIFWRHIFELPAALFHEVCHIFFIYVFLLKINFISFNRFYKVEGSVLYLNNIAIGYKTGNKFSTIIISLAPFIVFLLSPIISWWVFLYFVITFKSGLRPSYQDMSNVVNCCPKDSKIQKLMIKIRQTIKM